MNSIITPHCISLVRYNLLIYLARFKLTNFRWYRWGMCSLPNNWPATWDRSLWKKGYYLGVVHVGIVCTESGNTIRIRYTIYIPSRLVPYITRIIVITVNSTPLKQYFQKKNTFDNMFCSYLWAVPKFQAVVNLICVLVTSNCYNSTVW